MWQLRSGLPPSIQLISVVQTMVWIRFPCLNLMYYDKEIIKKVAFGVGKPVKVDMTTQQVEGGKYARVCVEINLAKPMHREIWINDHWHLLEYESLHLICATCRCYGHVSRACASNGSDGVSSDNNKDAAATMVNSVKPVPS